MTVATNVSKTQFLGSGSAGPFTFNFRFFANSEINVVKTSSLGVETTLTEGTGYTLTGAGSQAGGSLILMTVLESGETLEVIRTIPLTQPTSLRNQAAFFPEIHEDAFDRMLMQIQQVDTYVKDLETVQQVGALADAIQQTALSAVASANSASDSAGFAQDSSDSADASAASAVQSSGFADASSGFATASSNSADDAAASAASVQPQIDAFGVRVGAVEVGQSAAVIGYSTRALLTADNTPAIGTVAYVTNDATAANNGTYLKTGASAWTQSSYDRVALLETKVDKFTGFINVTTSYPLGAGLYYTWATAMAAVEVKYRTNGMYVCLETAQGVWQTWQYQGWSYTVQWENVVHWVQILESGCLTLTYTTDASTTRGTVPEKLRKPGLIVTYYNGTARILEQYVGIATSSGEWATVSNWIRLYDQIQATAFRNAEWLSTESFPNLYDYANDSLYDATNGGFYYVSISGSASGIRYGVDPLFGRRSYRLSLPIASRKMMLFPVFNSDILNQTRSLGVYVKFTQGTEVSLTNQFGLYVGTASQGIHFTNRIQITTDTFFYYMENQAIPNTANLRIGINLISTVSAFDIEFFGFVATSSPTLYPKDYSKKVWDDPSLSSDNLFDKATTAQSCSIASDGAISSGSAFMVSNVIPIDSTETSISMTDSPIMAVFFDSSFNVISSTSTAPLTIPANAKYLVFSYYKTAINTFCCNYGVKLNPYTAYKKSISHSWLPKITMRPYSGLKIATYGDSITAADNWQPAVQRITGALTYNRGVGGTRITNDTLMQAWFEPDGTYTGRPVIWSGTNDTAPTVTSVLLYSSMVHDERISTIPLDSSVVLLFGGANDISALGTAGDTPSDASSATFSASYRRTIEKINTRIPNVRIVCIGMPYHKTADRVDGVATSYTSRREMIGAIAKNYGLPFIDVKALCGWNALNVDYFLNPSDVVHPNAIGGDRMGEVIAGYLNSLLS